MLPGGLTDDDFAILEFIAKRDLVADVKTVEANLDIGYDRVNNRMRKLREFNLLKRPESTSSDISPRGLYEATELGKRYVEGDMTVRELRELLRDDEHG